MTIVHEHCSTCGVALRGARCAVCGRPRRALDLSDGDGSLPATPREGERPEAIWAFEAWARGETSRVIVHAMNAEGAQATKTRPIEGGTMLVGHFGGVFVTVLVADKERTLSIEVPVVRLPRTQIVGALRFALELSQSAAPGFRFSLRHELVLVRFSSPMIDLEPPSIQAALRDAVKLASDASRAMATTVKARGIDTSEQATFDFDTIPRALSIPLDGSPPPMELPPKAAASVPPTAKAAVPAAGDFKAPPMPQITAARPRPSGMSGMFESVLPLLGADQIPSLSPPAPAVADISKTQVSDVGIVPGVSAAPAPPKVEVERPKTTAPREQLCELLHRAQALGTVLSFADRPATMALVIRATVFRAILQFESTCRDAVAHLAHEASIFTKEIFITAPGRRSASMQIPSASPAFELMSAIVATGGTAAGTHPIVKVPIASVQDAKQHLARYLGEIDQAPQDMELRHFLAHGALAELLVRAKLPQATAEKLSQIVDRAGDGGPTQKKLDLMVAALTRMIQ